MASSSSSPPSLSSSSFSSSPPNYDVFLSFRGEDTRKTIVSHLYEALDGKGINTFKDEPRLEMGDHISDKLHNAIKGSKFAIVVLSKTYATSRWCLTELKWIMSFSGLGKLKVFPIFYGVDPSDVRHQKGSFSLKRYHDLKMGDNVGEWSEALNLVASLKGADSNNFFDDAMMVKVIVEDISTQLDFIQPSPLDDVFGVEAHIKRMKPLMELKDPHVRMIGLWGMGGIGKTTIARCLYYKFGRGFPAHSFIENVNETCKKLSLRYVQEKFIRNILGIKGVKLRNAKHGENLVRSRLGSLKVFVVLDGVEKKEQLDALAKETSWFGPGSRIIITTRDKKLLESCKVMTTIHEIQCLENEESLQMLKHFAFGGTNCPFDVYEELAIRASQLAQGLPLALEAFGLYLYGVTLEEWEGLLDTFEKAPHQHVMDVLRCSYMDLDPRRRTIFLKVACLFIGEHVRRVSTFLLETETMIKSLADKSLIHISNDGFIKMHSLIQQVGREIVLEESMYIPREQKLWWGSREGSRAGYDILKKKNGTEKFEGMVLHICDLLQPASSIDGSAFNEMHNLIFLKFFKHLDDMESKLDLISNNFLLPSSLKLLHWDAYSLTTLPSKFPVYGLVEIHLRYSNLERLWDGKPFLLELRMLDVTGSKNLKELPDFSSAPKFEVLITKGCTRLERIPETVVRLLSLKTLDASCCDRLINLHMIIGDLPAIPQRLPKIFRQVAVDFPYSVDTLNSLMDISIQGKLNFWFPHLRGKASYLSFSSEEQVPESLKLKANNKYGTKPELYGFKSLEIMRFNYKNDGAPFQCYSFSNFLCLTELNLINLNIKSFPENIGLLQELQKLDLSGNDFKNLPTEITGLSKMKSLGLCNCFNLQSLPRLIQLETLKVSDCINLMILLETCIASGGSYRLQKLWLDNCKSVLQLSNTLSNYASLTYLDLSGNDMVTMPVSIRLLTLLSTLCLNDCKKLKSMVQIPVHLTSLYARGCISLETIYLPLDHSIKHFDLSYCPQLNKVDDMINRFLTREQNKEVFHRFACLPGSRVPSYFNNQATSLPLVVKTSECVGFDACVIIACESPLHLKFSSSTYSCKQENNNTYRINIKPDFYLPAESTSKGEALSQHHMLIFHIPEIVTGHKFRLETYLELSEEFQSTPVKIISHGVRAIQKTQ